MDRHDKQFRRSLPDPPERSQDAYCAALAEAYRALDEAEMSAVANHQRERVREFRDDIRQHLMAELDAVGDE